MSEAGISVPPVEGFFPLTSLLVLGVLWLAKPEALEDLELEAQRLVGPVSRLWLLCYVLVAFVAAVAIARGCFFIVAELRRWFGSRTERAKVVGIERAALVSFFNATGGPAWKDSTNWLSSATPVHLWKGVSINHASGRVTKLVLSFNNLACEDFSAAGSSLGQLLALEELDLKGNALRGPLPLELCKLRRMQGLYLYDNYFTGNCPEKLIVNLKGSLRGIYLFNNHFENLETIRELCTKELQPDCVVCV